MTICQTVRGVGAQEAFPSSAPPDLRVRRSWWDGLLRALVAGLVVVAGLALPMVAPQSAQAVPPGTYAYVTNFNANTVSVVNTATNTVAVTVPVGAGPWEVAVSPNGTRAYVTNRADGTVSVINTATDTVVATVPVGLEPLGVAVSPDGTRAYVTNFGADTVSVIKTNTNTVVATLPDRKSVV